jgi:hypothetical protein
VGWTRLFLLSRFFLQISPLERALALSQGIYLLGE